jgi:hypothetical protein
MPQVLAQGVTCTDKVKQEKESSGIQEKKAL